MHVTAPEDLSMGPDMEAEDSDINVPDPVYGYSNACDGLLDINQTI